MQIRASSFVSYIALVTVVGCRALESTAPIAPVGSARAAAVTAAGASYTYTSFGATATYGVTGPFEDRITFSIPAAGAYQFAVVGSNRIVACSGRYCMSPGTIRATISSAVVQTSLGAAVGNVGTSTTLTLAAGDYVLVVDGVGSGTKRYLNYGTYTVNIRAPYVYVPPCDTVLGTLLQQGYTLAQAEAKVDAMASATPPQCIAD